MTAIAKEERPVPGERRHQPELDGIRGLAILLVLGSHAVGMLGVLPHRQPHPGWQSVVSFALTPGWGGVDLFFVLSGFLITGILLQTRERPHYFQSFYARRALRIFPIYYAFLIASLVVASFVPQVRELLPATTREIVSYFLYLQNIPWFWVGHPEGMFGMWGIFWSLAAEEQFYFVWPLVVRLLGSKRVLLMLCCVLFVLGLPFRLWLAHSYFGVTLGLSQFTPARADGLFAGAAITVWMRLSKRPVPMAWIGAATLVGAGILAWVAAFHTRELVGAGRLYTVGVTAFALLGAALVAWSQHHPPRIQQALENRWLRAAGRYSYGMYVYHLVVFYAVHALLVRLRPQTDGELPFVAALLVMAAAVLLVGVVAKASFDVFERRLLGLKRFFPA